ncbi:MAG: hypothetical protein JO022_15285 [Acidobacteriaceae bacterium]|nr:hypothetical protein [Acidobacteriaceae bacterium]
MRQESIENRLSRHDRELNDIRSVIKDSMKLHAASERRMARLEGNIDRLEANIGRLERAQEKTEATLQRFIRSLERGGANGHTKGRRAD